MRTSSPRTAAPEGSRDGRHAYDHLIPDLERLASAPAEADDRPALREYVIREFQPLVRNLSRRFAPGGNGAEDVEQAGMLGLVKAVDRYDPRAATGGPLGFLVPSIRGEMKRHLRDRSWAVRVPRDLKELAVRVRRTADALGQQYGRAPRPSEIAYELGVGTEEVVEALAALESHHARSLDSPVGERDSDGDDTPVGELLGAEDPALELAAHRAELRAAIDELPERERTILIMRFFGDRTQSQIAAQLGISQMHVSRLLSRTLARLRTQLDERA